MLQCPQPPEWPPLAQERAQWRSWADWRGNGRDAALARVSANVRPWRLGAGLLFGRSERRWISFLVERVPKGTEKVQVWYRSGPKLPVSCGLRHREYGVVPDKTPWMKDGLSGCWRPA
jgi:hypothetical protein